MKMAKRIAAAVLAFIMTLGMASGAFAAGPGDAAAKTINVSWNNLRLDASGLLSFDMQVPADGEAHVPQYYEVFIQIKTTGDFVANRTKKYKTSSLSVSEDITFPKVGIYRFYVVCHFVGGDVSYIPTGMDDPGIVYSPQCVVTEDYVTRPDDDGPGNVGPGGSSESYGPGSSSGAPSAFGKSGWYQHPATKKWYYAATTGIWLKNTWYFINNNWYYFDNDCSMHTGWLSLDGHWYYMHPAEAPEGHRAAGFSKIDGKWYYFDPGTGIMQTGVVAVGGFIYCMDASGAMLMNEGTPDGHFYNAEGHRIR